ncbi:hypothetical protein N2152v2_009388 [Parachlorella kessleri]
MHGVPTHTLCFRSAPAAAATITAIGGAPLWSRPITLRYPQEQTLHLLVPISLEEAASAGAGGATSGSSPTGRADTPQEGGLQGGAEGRPSAYLSPAVFDATAGGSDGGSGAASEDAGRRGGGHVKRDSAHLTVLAAEPGAAPGRGGAPGGAVAVLRVRVSLRGFGGLHVVLETLQSDPPYLLENRTPLPLNYRQASQAARRTGDGVLLSEYLAHIKAAPFHTLPPWSAVGWVWEYTLHGAPNELEVQEALAQNPQLYALDPPESSASGEEQPASAAGKVRPLPVTGDIGQCTVKLGYWEQVVMTPVGLGTIGGESSAGGLGRGGIDRVMQLAPGAERLLLAGKSGGQGGPLELDMAFELPGVEVSIVDHTPQELLLLTLTGLKVSATRGPTPSGAQNSLRFQLAQFQIDDQLFGARFPVVLATAPSALAARQQLQRGASPADLPLLSLTLSKQAGGARGRTFYPYAGLRAPLALQLAVSETLVWRVAEFLQRVQARQQQHTSGTAAGADGPQHEPTALHDTAAADMPLHIGLLHVDDLRAELSFQGDPLSRPRYISGGMVATLLDLANFTAASITLRGLDEPDISMLRSAFVQRIAQKVQGQVFGIAFSLVRNFGIVGGASKLLGALSAGVAKLAAAEVTPEASAAKQAQRRTITDVGDGVVEGMGALGQSFMRGLQGLVKKPVQGMQQKGVGGAIVGVGQGLVGALANPVSGMLDALSATAEGFNASFGRKRDDALVWQRRRLPRAVGGEGRLQPIIGSDGTDRQARIDALGQALLKNTLLNAPDATLKRRHEPTEAYEQHFVLVEDRVVILTSRGIMLVVAPNFAVLDGAAEIGEELRVVDVPPGTREWCVPWGDLLTLELRWTSDDPNADRLIVHRKGKPGVQETESLAHQLKCFPKTGQAAQIKLVTQKVLGKYCLDPQRRDRAWTRRHQSHQELPQGAGPAQLPLTMPCLDFEPAWRTTAHRISSAVSFWTPVAPPGYRPAGDVVTLGTDPPGNPVPCLRDFTLCGGAGAPPVAAAGLTSPAESQQQHKPATCHPREYSLVWRQNSANPVTVWMPVPPLGYVALGAVVVGRAEVPGTDDYMCIREDLTSASQVFNSPLWSLDPLSLLGGGGGAAASTAAAMALQRKKPHHPETWKISVWQVDNRLGTFLAVRAFNKPPQNMIRTVDAGAVAPEVFPVHDAVSAGDSALVSFLLASGYPCSEPDRSGDLPLHLAAALPTPALLARLLASGAHPDSQNPYWGDTPLCSAVQAGRQGSVELLLQCGADPQLCGRRAAVRAEARWKHSSQPAALAQMAACAPPHTPLYQAASTGQLSITRTLLRAGAAFSPWEQTQLGAELRKAAVMLKLPAVRALRAAGATLERPCCEELYAQAWGGELTAVQCWIAAGAALDHGMAARGAAELLAAVEAGDLPRVQRWLAAGVDPTAARDSQGRSALTLAAKQPGIARAMCEVPLQLAAELGQAGSLQAQLQLGGAAGLTADAKTWLLAAALGAGVRGDWLAVLLPGECHMPAKHLRRWVQAAGAFSGPRQGLPWARALLLALNRWNLPGELAQRVLAFGVLL